MTKQSTKTVSLTVRFPAKLADELFDLAKKWHQSVSEVLRIFAEKGLHSDSYTDEIESLREVIRQEVDSAVKTQTNRMAALLNRISILSAAGYYATVATITALIHGDRLTSFQKNERLARKRGLDYANTRGQDSLKKFMDDGAFTAAVDEIRGEQKKKQFQQEFDYTDFDFFKEDTIEAA